MTRHNRESITRTDRPTSAAASPGPARRGRAGRVEAREHIAPLELVDDDKITMLREQFSEHDKDGSGRLDRQDLSIIAKEKALRQQV